MPDLVAVLAEPNRRRLLELLSSGEQTAGALAAHFGVTRSAVSQHLGVLAAAGLVEGRREGRYRYYRLVPEGMAALRAALDVFWNNELAALASARPPNRGATPMSAEKSVLVPLSADDTFALLTEPERLRRWHAVTARIDVRAGGDYRWTIVPGHTAAGTVTEVEPGRRLVITWGWEGSDDLPPGASTVTITLEPADGGTTVRLVHEGLTAEQAAGHLRGWTHYLERLVRAAQRGDAGADEWASLPDPLDRLGAAEATLAVCQRVLLGLQPADATAATPCPKYTVDDLVEHLLQSIVHLGAAAGASVPVADDATPEARVAAAAQVALEAWRTRGLDGAVHLGPGEFPATVAANILSVEFLVHAWDLAQASGQQVVVSDEVAAYVLDLAHELIAPALRDGDRFGPEVEAGPDADNLERLAAFTGRAV